VKLLLLQSINSRRSFIANFINSLLRNSYSFLSFKNCVLNTMALISKNETEFLNCVITVDLHFRIRTNELKNSYRRRFANIQVLNPKFTCSKKILITNLLIIIAS
jgi:hypothetical protein